MLTPKQKKIHAHAVACAKHHRASEGDSVKAALDAFDHKVPWALGYQKPSKYVREKLGYDSPYGYRLGNVVKYMRRFPSLRKAIVSRRMDVEKASKLVAHLTPANAPGLVEFACTHTYDEMLAHIVGKAIPKQTRETVKQ